jgi:Methyltransferase domain
MFRLPRLTYLYPSALLYFLWTFTLGLLGGRGRARLASLGYEAPWFKSPLPVLSLNEVIGDVPQVTLYEVSTAAGNTTLLEQIVLARLAETAGPKNIFEFGTFDGRSALNLVAHSPKDAHLYTLDLPASEMKSAKLFIEPGEKAFIEKAESGTRFIQSSYSAQIERLYGDSAAFDFSPYFGRMDMVFVDASHAYDYVRCDTLNAIKLLRPQGGLIVWHDYSDDWPGVKRALNEFYRSGKIPFPSLRKIEGTTLVMLRA